MSFVQRYTLSLSDSWRVPLVCIYVLLASFGPQRPQLPQGSKVLATLANDAPVFPDVKRAQSGAPAGTAAPPAPVAIAERGLKAPTTGAFTPPGAPVSGCGLP